ncbi:hypothetical protein IE53DRAFT_42788 [Violaceomyces palustris]|uniref:Uncharacterized protein n=1 Tax=Violaceomyces palustris TaxID=1673888 RepID=A0ACD0P128_9BASI|nr:hypothetical protein IE53DRAFT_42788 [Violaceomyces palustris]
MATASRRRSVHTSGSSAGSLAASGRRGSSGKLAGSKSRFDPAFMMSSNSAQPDEGGSRSNAGADPRQHHGAARRNKSTDRLSRASESGTNLAGKRSKSHTHLGLQSTEDTAARRRRDSSLGSGAGRNRGRRGKNDDAEDGWTSASQTNTPSDSAGVSPVDSPTGSLEDEGLVMGIKRRDRTGRTARANVEANPQAADGPQIDVGNTVVGTEDASQPPDTPKVSAKKEIAPDKARNEAESPRLPSVNSSNMGELQLGLQYEPQAEQQRQDQRETRELSIQRERTTTASIHSTGADSDDTLAQEPSQRQQMASNSRPPTLDSTSEVSRQPLPADSADLSVPSSSRPPHRREVSASSNRTLRGGIPLNSSPVSVRSRSSILSTRPGLFPRDSQGAAAPPKLDTHNALAGALGALHEDRGEGQRGRLSRRGRMDDVSLLPSSSSEPAGFDGVEFPSSGYGAAKGSADAGSYRRKASLSSMNGSGIALPLPSPSIGNVSNMQAGRGAGELNVAPRARGHRGSISSMYGESALALDDSLKSNDRRRTTSTQSLTAADAAKLAAKLRQARDAINEQTASGALRGASSQLGSHLRPGNPYAEKYNKPVVSTFAKEDPTWFGAEPVAVTEHSVYATDFSQAHQLDKSRSADKGREMTLRYVLDYALGGPPIQKGRLTDALLGPVLDSDDFESSWAPALANAAGLGSRSVGHPGGDGVQVETEFPTIPLAAQDTNITVDGPNSTPLHFIHGLTTTSPDPFPLDPTDVPALENDLPSDPSALVNAANPIRVEYVDPTVMRAIAMTSQAISTHRSHTVVRRFADPMRGSLERVARSSGKWGLNPLPTHPGTNSPLTPRGLGNSPSLPNLAGGATSGGGASSSRWGGRRTAPNSPGPGVGGGSFGPSGGSARAGGRKPALERSNTTDSWSNHGGRTWNAANANATTPGGGANAPPNLANQLHNLVDAAEYGLKRVWSGGLGRGGLAALRRTEEEA